MHCKYTCYRIQLIHTYTDVIVVHAYSHYIFYIYTNVQLHVKVQVNNVYVNEDCM